MADDQPQRSRSRPSSHPPRSPTPSHHSRLHSTTQHTQHQPQQYDQQYQQQQPARVSHLPFELQRHMLGPPLDPTYAPSEPNAAGPQLPPLTLGPQSAPMAVPSGSSDAYAYLGGGSGGYPRVASSLPVQWAPQDSVQRRYPNPMWDDSAQRAAGWATGPDRVETEDVEMANEEMRHRRRSYGPSRAASPTSHMDVLPQAVLPPLRDPSTLYPSYGSTSNPPTRVHTASPQIRAPRPSTLLQPPVVEVDVNMRGRSWDTIMMVPESSTSSVMNRTVASTASQGSASDDEAERESEEPSGIPPAVAAAASTGPGSYEAGPSSGGGKKAPQASNLRRAEKACNYCRDRKLRCTPLGDGREGCRTCEVYGKECVYVGVVKRRGPGVRKDKGSSAGGEESVEDVIPTTKKTRKSRAGATSATRGGSRRRGAATSVPPQPLPSPVLSTESGGAEVPPSSSTASSPRRETTGFFNFPMDRTRELSTPVQGGVFDSAQESTRMAWSVSPSAQVQRQQSQYGGTQGLTYRDARSSTSHYASEELSVPVSRSESRSPNTFPTGPSSSSSARMLDPRLSTSGRVYLDDATPSTHDQFGYPSGTVHGEHVESGSYSTIPPTRYQHPHQHRQIPQHPSPPSSSPTGLLMPGRSTSEALSYVAPGASIHQGPVDPGEQQQRQPPQHGHQQYQQHQQSRG